ncbi:DsbA family protein [Candidatus Kaiserbacteria bacterium]|nr:DsbA family protein [Candidatus Kaiserbacteria bacterium]
MKQISQARRFSSSARLGTAAIAVLVIATLVLYVYNERISRAQYESTAQKWSLIVRAITVDDHIIGSPTAPIHVVVYSDLSCPYCKSFFESLVPRLQAKYGAKIVIAFRHLPLKSHPRALAEAEASECVYKAGGNDAFWRFANVVYANPDYESGLSDQGLATIAGKVLPDAAGFTSCIKDGGGTARVKKDALEAAVAGLSITPSVVVKSSRRATIIAGDYYGQIVSAINYQLQVSASAGE